LVVVEELVQNPAKNNRDKYVCTHYRMPRRKNSNFLPIIGYW
jgi:hypothetical protein